MTPKFCKLVFVPAGPIPESKGMRAIFQKKGKIFKNLGKNVQNLKIFEKRQPHACDYHMYETATICPHQC